VVPAYGPPALTDACLRALAANTPPHELVLIDSRPQGLSFARACNEGARSATRDALVFLNCDTEPLPGWLPPLLDALREPLVGAAGARLLYPDGSIQHTGVTIHREPAEGINRTDEHPTEDVDGVTGACLAIRREVFPSFDEGFVNGYEDVDLCLGLRQAGYRIRYVAESTVMHHESATGAARWSHAQQNVDRLQAKWSQS
jgi:GT2 family glycosyltransferase